MTVEYVVLVASVMGGPDRGFETIYAFDGECFSTRAAAISHGFSLDRSDDFNVGVVRDGRFVSLDWMEITVDADPAVLAAVSAQVGLAS